MCKSVFQWRTSRTILCTGCAAFSLFFLISCNETVISSQTRAKLGTVCTIQLFEKGKQRYYDALFERLDRVEELMSMNIPTSDISRINASAGIQKVYVHDDTFEVLQRALHFAQLTEGAFNPAGGALVKLWNIGSDSPHLPSQEEIDQVLPLCDWQSVVLTEEENTAPNKKNAAKKKAVYLSKKGTLLDLGGIAKGYAADQLAVMLKKQNIKSAIVDLGGNIYVIGEKKGNQAWKVGIKNPFDTNTAPVVALSVKDSSVVTSGLYERFFEHEGQIFHHLLNYKTGRPADNGLMSVTIVNSSSMNADALATAVFIMGKTKGPAFLQKHSIKGLCIDTEKEILSTATVKAQTVLLNGEFTIR